MSTNAGGLVRWPSYLMMPIGFVLLGLQSLSELIKRVAFLRGLAPDPAPSKTKSDEELLLEDIRKAAEAKDAK
jgi:TRAP-type mannitol/chloroaromatic compound transport system permease small subunit